MKKLMTAILSLFISLSFMGINAFAAETSDIEESKSVTVYSTDLEGNLLAIDGVPVGNKNFDGMTGQENIQLYNALGVSQKNTKYISRQTKKSAPLFTGRGTKGGTIRMHTTASYSTTLSGGFGVSAAEFNVNMGFSKTASISFGIDYDYKVTKARTEITAYPVIYTYTFDCYYLGFFKSSGKACAPRGIDYVVTNY